MQRRQRARKDVSAEGTDAERAWREAEDAVRTARRRLLEEQERAAAGFGMGVGAAEAEARAALREARAEAMRCRLRLWWARLRG
jgi:hypothetical protein